MREVGLKQQDIPALAQSALDDVCTGGSPRQTSLDDIKELYQAIYQLPAC